MSAFIEKCLAHPNTQQTMRELQHARKLSMSRLERMACDSVVTTACPHQGRSSACPGGRGAWV
jgi:hypothetical protein